ncbi:MAG: NAD-dependent epimerase/dehydratase family protein [Gammaproteobacteria bacterium]|nr:NAD-dependent epimerase/dehydratase family protein [Gammaproteobacteria bacterium]
MTKYLVTGSTGFIGSRLLGLLSTIECDVRLLARSKVDNYETVVCNLEQNKISKHTFESVDTVFHLAGFAHDMRDADKIADLYHKVNVGATVQLANLAVKSGVKRFVFVSSVKAGGAPPLGTCANEKDQKEAEGVYGKTKREAELKLLEIGRVTGMHVSIIRPALVYGPDVKGNLQLMLSGIERGWFPPLPEAGNRRSMIHVDDLVRAILLVAEDKRANGEIFIATDGIPYSSREIYEAMCSLLNKKIPHWSIPKFFFDFIASLDSQIRYKVDKLLGDECYSSEKLQSIGFGAKQSLSDMNETSF